MSRPEVERKPSRTARLGAPRARPLRYVWVDRLQRHGRPHLRQDGEHRVPDSWLAVLGALALYADLDGSNARPGVDRLAADTSRSKRTVDRALTWALWAGWLEVQRAGRGPGNATCYRLTVPLLAAVTDSEKRHETRQETRHETRHGREQTRQTARPNASPGGAVPERPEKGLWSACAICGTADVVLRGRPTAHDCQPAARQEVPA